MRFDPNGKDFSIWFSKNLKGNIAKNAKEAKSDRCYLCGKECSYPKSHSIPDFVLSNLSNAGEYANFASFLQIDFIRGITGKAKAGTFRLLCESCENSYFRDYEDKSLFDSLKIPFSQPVLYQIAIKNLLYQIDKANEELSSQKAMLDLIASSNEQNSSGIKHYIDELEKQLKFSAVDTCERLKLFEGILKYDKYCYDGKYKGFKIILQSELPYKVPIAVQLAIPVSKGLSGEIINDFKNTMHLLHLCIFPLENKSLILLFCHSANDYYDKFEKDLSNKNFEGQLEVINYMLLLFSEDYFCNVDILKKVQNNEALVRLCAEQAVCDLSQPIPQIPNLLNSEYALT